MPEKDDEMGPTTLTLCLKPPMGKEKSGLSPMGRRDTLEISRSDASAMCEESLEVWASTRDV